MTKKRKPTVLYTLLTVIGLLVTTAIIARSAGWIGIVEKPVVTLATAQRMDLAAVVSSYGVVQPAREVVVQSELSGEIVQLLVAEGDTVQEGQLLATLRTNQIDAALNQVRAIVNQRWAQRAEARAQYLRAQAQLRQAETTYQRSQTLHREGVIPDVEWETVQARYRTAQQEEQVARQGVRIAQHTVAEAQASLQQVLHNKQQTQLYAPLSGTVTVLSVQEGERIVGTNVQSGTEVMRIANLNRMEVRVPIEETDMMTIDVGDSAAIHVEALPTQVLTGKVSQLAYQANFRYDPKAGSEYGVSIVFDAPPTLLRIGMTASVDIIAQQQPQTLTVPLLAATTRRKKVITHQADSLEEVLFVYDRGKVVQRTVQLGIHNRNYIEVLVGLAEGEQVVSGPYHTVFHELANGMRVETQALERYKTYVQ